MWIYLLDGTSNLDERWFFPSKDICMLTVDNPFTQRKKVKFQIFLNYVERKTFRVVSGPLKLL